MCIRQEIVGRRDLLGVSGVCIFARIGPVSVPTFVHDRIVVSLFRGARFVGSLANVDFIGPDHVAAHLGVDEVAEFVEVVARRDELVGDADR